MDRQTATDHEKQETSFSKCLYFADGNEGGKMGSTVTAAVIGIVVPMGECGPKSLGRKERACPRVWGKHWKDRALSTLTCPTGFSFCPGSLPAHLPVQI